MYLWHSTTQEAKVSNLGLEGPKYIDFLKMLMLNQVENYNRFVCYQALIKLTSALLCVSDVFIQWKNECIGTHQKMSIVSLSPTHTIAIVVLYRRVKTLAFFPLKPNKGCQRLSKNAKNEDYITEMRGITVLAFTFMRGSE